MEILEAGPARRAASAETADGLKGSRFVERTVRGVKSPADRERGYDDLPVLLPAAGKIAMLETKIN